MNRYPVAFTRKLPADTLVPIELFGESWVLFRDDAGAAACVYDECAHRACPLSLGTVVEGEVKCPYHGWQFNAGGECTKMPSTVQCKGIQVAHLPVEEKDGFVWVWPGGAAPVPVPDSSAPPAGFTLHAEIEVRVCAQVFSEAVLTGAFCHLLHCGALACCTKCEMSGGMCAVTGAQSGLYRKTCSLPVYVHQHAHIAPASQSARRGCRWRCRWSTAC